jgi:hypothetical protein
LAGACTFGGTMCFQGKCLQVQCGNAGEPCCDGNSCTGGACCVNGSCIASGSACQDGTCSNGSCGGGTCGGLGQPCCASVYDQCTAPYAACSGSTCVTCGGAGQPCCTDLFVGFGPRWCAPPYTCNGTNGCK